MDVVMKKFKWGKQKNDYGNVFGNAGIRHAFFLVIFYFSLP